MKSKALLFLLLFISIIFSSCKKESVPAIAGNWHSVSFYEPDQNGAMSWVYPVNYVEFAHFDSDGSFSFLSDIPMGGGTYFYDRSTQQLTLNYNADRYGNPARTTIASIESITKDQLIITYHSGNLVAKTQYLRFD